MRPLAAEQQRKEGARDAVDADEVDFHLVAQRLRREVHQRPRYHGARVVHQHFEGVGQRSDLCDRGVDARGLGHVEPHRDDVQEPAERTQVPVLARAGEHVVAAGGHVLDDGAVDAAAGSGNQDRSHGRCPPRCSRSDVPHRAERAWWLRPTRTSAARWNRVRVYVRPRVGIGLAAG